MPGARFFSLVIISTLALMPPLTAQQTGSSGNSGTGSRSAGRTRTQAPPSQERRMVFISGRVMMDEGTVPPERISIERVCNGRVRREAYTDSHGNFSFQLGAEADVMQDASVGAIDGVTTSPALGGRVVPGVPATTEQSTGVTQRELIGCELRAALKGYRSDVVELGARQLFDNPDVGVIVLHRTGKSEGTSVSVTSLQAPHEARKAWEEAQKAMAKKHTAEAIADLEKAVRAYPKYAEALAQLGQLYSNENRREDAARVLQQAIAADPKYVPPYSGLAFLAGVQGDWNRMAELSARAISLDAYDFPLAYFYNAVANFNLHNLDVAEKSARQARRLDSQYHIPPIDFVLGSILMQRQDYAGAADELRTFLKYESTGAKADDARRMLGETEQKMASRTLPQK